MAEGGGKCQILAMAQCQTIIDPIFQPESRHWLFLKFMLKQLLYNALQSMKCRPILVETENLSTSDDGPSEMYIDLPRFSAILEIPVLTAAVFQCDDLVLGKGSSTKYDHFMRVSTNKNEENEKPSTKGSSTKYDHFMRVCTKKNEENEKLH